MNALSRRPKRPALALFLGLSLCALAAGPALAAAPVQVDARDLLIRLQRLERDLRDLQAETFRRPPGAAAEPAPLSAGTATGTPDLEPVMRRLDEFGASLSRLTGEMEELGHRVDQLSQRADRLQKEMEYQSRTRTAQSDQAEAIAPGGEPLGNPAPNDAVASLAPDRGAPDLAPGPRNLGEIPAGTLLPTPDNPLPAAKGAGADAKTEFDGAMNLLSRAQYPQASQAFRSFADTYPDDARAPAALYWTGDIAYSTNKDYEEAARDFAELLKKYPMAQRAPEGMLKLGLSLFELGQMREGCAALAALPAKYPTASAAIATRARNERRDRKCR